ncbi:pentatricopeptide repeat-containing protein [Sesbania bispinosa]|nr:pentatricopeptide repeat-containing protein [Sesbania bispinosa]
MRPVSPSTATSSKHQLAETKEKSMVLTCEEDGRLFRNAFGVADRCFNLAGEEMMEWSLLASISEKKKMGNEHCRCRTSVRLRGEVREREKIKVII